MLHLLMLQLSGHGWEKEYFCFDHFLRPGGKKNWNFIYLKFTILTKHTGNDFYV